MKRVLRLSLIAAVCILLLADIAYAQTATMPSGSGTSGDPYLIATLNNLYWVTQNSSSWGSYFQQTADIDASADSSWNSGAGFRPIGTSSNSTFYGVYDGNGHTISGLFISQSTGSDLGLFGDIFGATVKNIGLLNERVTQTRNIGNTGGLVGAGYQSTIDNCYTTGSVTLGPVESQGVGGSVGGLVGAFPTFPANYINMNSTVSNSHSTATVTGARVDAVGGLVGSSGTTQGHITLSNCFSTGAVSDDSSSAYVGGLVGVNYASQSITDCYSTGSVSAAGSSDIVGGLVGWNYTSTISDCYSSGNVVGGTDVGGLVGSNTSGTINNSFWDIQSSGQTSSAGGTGESTAAMKTQSTFTGAGWNFASTWAIDAAINSGYPGLLWQSEYVPAAPSASTNTSMGVTRSAATLNGSVSLFKGTTTVKFIYGTVSGNYPDTVAASPSPLSGWGAVAVSATITSLSSHQTYFYRVIASSTYGSAQGSELNFTTSSPPTLSTVPGSSLSFNGTNQYVSVLDNTSLQITDNLTLEAWVYPTGSANLAIIDKGNYNYLFEIFPNGNPGLGLYNASWGWIYSAGAVPTNTWSHVALVFQTGTNGVKFYLNGSLLSQHTAPGSLMSNTGEFAIGKQAPGNCDCNFFQGLVDEVRVWSVARTTQQIRESMHRTLAGTETGLVSYWQFNEGSGTIAADSIGGNHGTLVNGPAWATSTIPAGGGTSNSVSSFTSGTAALGTVSLTTTDAFDNAVDLTATQINTAPDSLPGLSSTELTDRYWVVDAFGTTGTFSSTLAFVVPPTFTNSGAASSSSYNLYRRNSTSDGSWTLAVSGASSVTADSVVFDAVSSLGQFTIGSGIPLPVELVSFTGSSERLDAELTWTTATEVDNYGFEVQRSPVGNKSSAQTWAKAGFVQGSGTSNSSKKYSFTDSNIPAGKYSYRLKQIDHAGAFKYSAEIDIAVGAAPKVFELSQNFPNPFNPATNIQFTVPRDGRATVKIYNALAQEVATPFDGVATAGEYHQVTFDASHLASGIYFSRLEFDGKMQVKKMLLLK